MVRSSATTGSAQTGPTALITGAARGLGAAIARELAPTHRVLLGARSAAALIGILAELPGATASKFGLRAFGDALRLEERDLRVTSIHPGRIDTDMQRAIVATEGREYHPEEFLTPETVARAVRHAVQTPRDAHPVEVVLRPA
jgi:NADP-dependent 3-hydroxy acid dehydrogenase YdfG